MAEVTSSSDNGQFNVEIRVFICGILLGSFKSRKPLLAAPFVWKWISNGK